MSAKTWRGAVAAAALLALSAGAAEAADQLTLQLKWVTQAQFAGYYVAKDKGFYDEVGLDVTIKPGGPDINPSQVIAGGGADVVVDWMPSALATREKGVPLVNIAQVFQKSGMMLTCRKDSGVTSPDKFEGKTLGVWFGGNEYPFLNWMAKLGLKTDGSAGGVKVLKQGFNVDPLLQKQADCISHHDLQRVLAGDRRRHEAGGADHLQIRGPGRRDPRGRALHARGHAARTRPRSRSWRSS